MMVLKKHGAWWLALGDGIMAKIHTGRAAAKKLERTVAAKLRGVETMEAVAASLVRALVAAGVAEDAARQLSLEDAAALVVRVVEGATEALVNMANAERARAAGRFVFLGASYKTRADAESWHGAIRDAIHRIAKSTDADAPSEIADEVIDAFDANARLVGAIRRMARATGADAVGDPVTTANAMAAVLESRGGDGGLMAAVGMITGEDVKRVVEFGDAVDAVLGDIVKGVR